MSVEITENNARVEIDGGSHEVTIVEQSDHVVLVSQDSPHEVSIQEQVPNSLTITVIEHTVELSEDQYFVTIVEGGGGTGNPTSPSGPGLYPASNFNATTDPTTDDDSGDGYVVGSRWINISTDEEFVCVDATVGSAVWLSTTAGTSSQDYVDISARKSTDDNIVYAGRSEPEGAPTSSASWQIYQKTVSTGDVLYADGDMSYDNIWDDRESLSYS